MADILFTGPRPRPRQANTWHIHKKLESINQLNMNHHQATLVPTNKDVLLGKGTPINRHAGNIAFRALIRQKQDQYDAAPEGSKHFIAKDIVHSLRDQGWRFLRRTLPTVWEEVPMQRAYRKAQQTLRDGAPERRKKRLQEQLDRHGVWSDQDVDQMCADGEEDSVSSLMSFPELCEDGLIL